MGGTHPATASGPLEAGAVQQRKENHTRVEEADVIRARVWLVQALVALLVFATTAIPAMAQAQADQLAAANSGLRAAAESLRAGQENPGLAVSNAKAALAQALQVQAALQAELASQPQNDVVRSRSQAVLDQTNEAIRDLQAGLAQQDQLAAKLQAAEAQVLEAIAELQPALGQTAAQAPAQLPSAGEMPMDLWAALVGFVVAAAGLATKRLAVAR